MFELAKNELTELSQKGKFNFTMATIDCHMPQGFLCKYCPNTYENRYENIYACQSKLINSFIDWCKLSIFYLISRHFRINKTIVCRSLVI